MNAEANARGESNAVKVLGDETLRGIAGAGRAIVVGMGHRMTTTKRLAMLH